MTHAVADDLAARSQPRRETIDSSGDVCSISSPARRSPPVCALMFVHEQAPLEFLSVFVSDERTRWRTACCSAGLGFQDAHGHIAGPRVVHDLRRTAVRNLVRAGVPERVAIGMTGHKTRPVFERCSIRSEDDLDRAPRISSRHGAKSSGGGWQVGTIRAQSPPCRSRSSPRWRAGNWKPTTASWWNWQTRQTQNLLPARAWAFESPRGHPIFQSLPGAGVASAFACAIPRKHGGSS